jgi:orsellinic acid C2-O-methyltransferase
MGDQRNTLLSMLFGYFPPQALYVATRLGLADQLAPGPRPAAELASAAGCDPQALRRLLRALVVMGVLEQCDPDQGDPDQGDPDQPDTFALTETGQLLRTDDPASMRNYVLLFCGEQVWQSWGDLEYSVRTGKSAWEKRYGPPFGPGFMTPEFSGVFNAAMAEGSARAAPAVIAAGEFGRFGTLADLGGGRGILLAAILSAHPGLRGILFDLPRALDGAADVLRAAGTADRCELVPGDFFEAVPGGADAYLLKSVIHDWDDERAASILGHVRAAMSPGATLLLVEPVMSERPSEQDLFSVSYSDLNMLVCTSGRERTEAEFGDLLTGAGFTIRRITACPPTGYRIIEAGLR